MKVCSSLVLFSIGIFVVHASVHDESLEIESQISETRENDPLLNSNGFIPELNEDLVKKTMEEARRETIEEEERTPRLTQDDDMSFQMKHYRRGLAPELESIRTDALVKERTIKKIAKQLGMSNKDTIDALQHLESSSLDSACRKIPRADPNKNMFKKEYRTIDGKGNNRRFVNFGRANTPFQRLVKADYADGMSSPRKASDGSNLPNARDISRKLFNNADHPSKKLAHMAMTWGQFLDHDITQTAESHTDCSAKNCAHDGDCFGISISPNDLPFRGRSCIDVRRSVPFCKTRRNPKREQINTLSSFIDASAVYASAVDEFDSLRDPGDRALLLETRDKLLSKQKPDDFCRSPDVKNKPCFRAGDARTNENSGLASMHTIWNREHNRIVKELRELNPSWCADHLFFEARKIVGAMVQHITYNEFLPAILSKRERRRFRLVLEEKNFFRGYSIRTNPKIFNGFATAAYRFGHSLVQNQLNRIDSWLPCRKKSPIPMDRFFDTSFLYEKNGAEAILRGLTSDRSQKVDGSFSVAVHEKLVRGPNDLSDLPAINIQRGRDHGIPGYTKYLRLALRSRRISIRKFSDLKIVMEEAQIKNLKSVYKHVDDIDLFAGGVNEKSFQGSALGRTFSFIIAKQFKHLRIGDRFWYENKGQFTRAQLKEIRKTSLARVICDNGEGIKFIFAKAIEGKEPTSCADLKKVELAKWKERPKYVR